MSVIGELAKGVAVVILGGGRGTRLDPLTRLRSKPAVPFAGKYRHTVVALDGDLQCAERVHPDVGPGPSNEPRHREGP